MPKELNGVIYYRSNDVCERVGIGRSTLLSWLDKGILDTVYRDRNGWRIYTSDDIIKLKSHKKYTRK